MSYCFTLLWARYESADLYSTVNTVFNIFANLVGEKWYVIVGLISIFFIRGRLNIFHIYQSHIFFFT